MEQVFDSNIYCKSCKFYNVGCHPILKDRQALKPTEIPDCYRKAIGW